MHLFAYLCSALNLGAALTYFVAGDRWRAAYWLAGAVLTFSTTRMR